MKKRTAAITVIIVFCVGLIIGSGFFHTKAPTIRKYIFEGDGVGAYLILKEDNDFEFNYSLYSSVIPTGKYEVADGRIYCYDNSEYSLKYVFDIKDRALSFNEALSSKLPGFSEIADGSLFK